MNHIVIGICDDRQEAVVELRKFIVASLHERKEICEIRGFASGNELLQNIEELTTVFLDIDMPVLDGIQTGREIMKRNPNCRIIMATGMVERFKEAFKIKAVRFVTKPFIQEEVEEALDAVISNLLEQKTVDLYLKRNVYQILQSEIAYIRAFNGYTEYAVNGRWMRKEVSLEEAEQFFDVRIFARISRQFIVNLAYVESYKNGEIILDGTNFKVSRRLRKEFEQKYIEYDLRFR